MPRTGVAHLPLHGGKCPRWLFEKMRRLAPAIIEVIVREYGGAEVLRRVSDPVWFQAFGCVLGYDWHSSGLTTTVCGAIKDGLKERCRELGLFVAGGKGKTSRKTPDEIEEHGSRAGLGAQCERLIYASKMSAKVDNTALQDGYQLYHHVFFFTSDGRWAVVQQGMNESNGWARRYHWLGEDVKDFVVEPHSAVCCDEVLRPLNMVAVESEAARRASVELAGTSPREVIREYEAILRSMSPGVHIDGPVEAPRVLRMGGAHEIPLSRNLERTLLRLYERKPRDYETLLGIEGVGPKTVRALALVSEVAFGAPPSFRDPVKYSFAHGGKDGHPYPVDRETYTKSIELLRSALEAAKIGKTEKLQALRKLAGISP